METKHPSFIDQIVDDLIHIHPLLSKNLTRSIRLKTNINPGSLFILGLLSRYEFLSMSDIGCKLSIPKPHVTAQVDKLIQEELVERFFDPNDRRIVNIRMTEQGKIDFKTIKQDVSADMRSLVNTLDEEKQLILLESARNVRTILTEIMVDNSHINTCDKN